MPRIANITDFLTLPDGTQRQAQLHALKSSATDAANGIKDVADEQYADYQTWINTQAGKVISLL